MGSGSTGGCHDILAVIGGSTFLKRFEQLLSCTVLTFCKGVPDSHFGVWVHRLQVEADDALGERAHLVAGFEAGAVQDQCIQIGVLIDRGLGLIRGG